MAWGSTGSPIQTTKNVLLGRHSDDVKSFIRIADVSILGIAERLSAVRRK
jgi:hypothetical protein